MFFVRLVSVRVSVSATGRVEWSVVVGASANLSKPFDSLVAEIPL